MATEFIEISEEEYQGGSSDFIEITEEEFNKPQEEPREFFSFEDAVSAIGTIPEALAVGVPAAYQKLVTGLEIPEKSEAIESELAFQQRIQTEQADRVASGKATTFGSAIREALPSLGFSVLPMAAAIPAGIGGTMAGGPAAPVTGPAAAMAASGTVAYRMAGSDMMYRAYKQLEEAKGSPLTNEEKAEYYKTVLPIAQNYGLWEAGPEAVSNAITMGVGKFVFGFGKQAAKKLVGESIDSANKTIARKVAEKGAAVAGGLGTEIASEGITSVGQYPEEAKIRQLAATGEVSEGEQPSYPGGYIQAVKDVAPATIALYGMMGTAAGGVKLSTLPFRSQKTPEQIAEDNINLEADRVSRELSIGETDEETKSINAALQTARNNLIAKKEVYTALEPNDPAAQSLGLEIREMERDVVALDNELKKRVGEPLSEPITEAERQQAELAKAIVEEPAPTEPLPVPPAPVKKAASTPPVLYHGGRKGMSTEDIQIVREPGATKQGKRGRVYGGFYTTEKLNEAEQYAAMLGEDNTVYEVQLNPSAVVETYAGDITRLSPQRIEEFRNRGVDIVVGKDVRGRTENVIINKEAVASFSDINKPPSAPVEQVVTPPVEVAPTIAEPAPTTPAPTTPALVTEQAAPAEAPAPEVAPVEISKKQTKEEFENRFLSTEVTVNKNDPRFSKSKEVSVGPGGISNVVQQSNLSEVVKEPSVYHESNLDSIRKIVSRISAGPRNIDLWTSNSIDLALGQGGKGYVLELDTKKVNGSIAPSLAAEIQAGVGAAVTEIKVNKTAPSAIKSIIVPSNAGLNALRKTAGFEKLFDFDNATQTERGIRIPVKQKPTPAVSETITEPAIEPESKISKIKREWVEYIAESKNKKQRSDRVGIIWNSKSSLDPDEREAAEQFFKERLHIKEEERKQEAEVKEPAKPKVKAKQKIKPQAPVLDPIGYGNALIDLFPTLKSAGVKAISMEESLARLEKEWEEKQKSGKAKVIDKLVYLANKRNTESALAGGDIGGTWSRSDLTVAVSSKATPSAMAHEIGHAIMELEFANADQKTKDAIIAEYNKWFASTYGKDGVPSVADQRRIWEWMQESDWLDPKAPFPQEKRVASWEQYRSSFSEWFADEVAKWATTNAKPKSLIEKFFTELAAKLNKLWNAVSENFAPNETLAMWLDSITSVSPSKVEIAPKGDKIELLEATPEPSKPTPYDDAGNLIPLSERFQPTSPDIRMMAVEPEQGDAPIKPEAKTVTEGLVQGIDIGKENNMPINNKIESHIKNFAFVRGIFESASDRLRRAKFTKLATAIDDYYDQAQRRLGFANKILLPAFEEYSKQSKATKKKIDEEVKMFFAAQENKRDTAEFFDELNPITQKIVTSWQKFGEESGNENKRIGIKVYDKGLQRWRPIGRVDKFWPRVLKPEYKRALMEPDKYQKEYNEIVEALMKSGRIENPEEAEVFISEYEGTGSKNDYFSGIETARGQAFPEELYDYSTQVMTDYVARWAQHSSRIEQFGQKLGENSMTLWDKSRASTRDRRTIDYITAAQERVEGYYPNDPIVKGMAILNIWSSGLQLGNPASSLLNFFGGTALNAMVGQPGAFSSYLSSFVELRKLGKELKDAREKGIVSRDLMNIVGDHQVVLESNGLAKAGQKTTDFLLKWSGFTPVEQMVRTQSMIIGKSFLRKTLSSLSKNPNSTFSKRALTWLNRNSIDADKLIVEKGSGPETDKLLRYFANISQGSYTIAQTPIFTDTPIGRFLFKYQKFSTQVMRQSWKNTFEPAWKAVTNKNEMLQLPDPTRQLLYRLRLAEAKELGDNRKITLDEIPKKVTKAEGKALTIIPVMMWLGSAYVGGEIILRMRDMLFGVLMKGPSYEDIIRAFEDDEDDDELYLTLERAWYNLIGMGALGLIGNYAQFFMDWQDRERVKNPLDPPALSIAKETGTFIQNAADQGKITVGDVNNYLNRTLSAYRVSQRLYQTAASKLGFSKAPTVAEEMFRRETAVINKYARRWAESAGLEYRTKRPMDIAPSKMTSINREIASYLQRGEPGAAVAYAKEYLNSLPKSERKNAIQSMESGARFRQPFRLGNGPMDKSEKKAFTEWLKEKVSKEDFDKFQKLDKGYKKSYDDFLRGLPNK